MQDGAFTIEKDGITDECADILIVVVVVVVVYICCSFRGQVLFLVSFNANCVFTYRTACTTSSEHVSSRSILFRSKHNMQAIIALLVTARTFWEDWGYLIF